MFDTKRTVTVTTDHTTGLESVVDPASSFSPANGLDPASSFDTGLFVGFTDPSDSAGTPANRGLNLGETDEAGEGFDQAAGSRSADRRKPKATGQNAIEFRVTRPGSPNRRLRLTGNRYTFGNAEGCSIRLSDLTLRPMHAVLIRDAARVFVRAYSVPILVNGSRATEATLKPGDILQLGDYRFELLEFTTGLPVSGLDAGLSTTPRSVLDGAVPPASKTSEPAGHVPAADDLLWRERLRREIDQWRDRQADCDRREHRCDEREADLRTRESELWTRAENLYRREARLQSQEAAAFQLYDEFTQRQQELLRLREEAQHRQESFHRREAEFRNLEFEYRHRLEDAGRQLQQAQQQAETATQAVQRMRAQFESLNRQIEDLSEQQRDIDQREQKQREEHERLRQELTRARDEALEQTAESDQRRQEAESRVQQMAAELEALRSGEEADLVAQREHLAVSERLVTELQQQVDQLQQSVEEATRQSQQYRQDYEEAQKSVQQLESIVAQSSQRGEQDRESWASETEELRASIEQLSIELAKANGELSELREANAKLSSRLDTLRSERDQAHEELQSRPSAEALKSVEQELQSASVQLSQLRNDYERTLTELEQSRVERAQAEQRLAEQRLAEQRLAEQTESRPTESIVTDSEPAESLPGASDSNVSEAVASSWDSAGEELAQPESTNGWRASPESTTLWNETPRDWDAPLPEEIPSDSLSANQDDRVSSNRLSNADTTWSSVKPAEEIDTEQVDPSAENTTEQPRAARSDSLWSEGVWGASTDTQTGWRTQTQSDAGSATGDVWDDGVPDSDGLAASGDATANNYRLDQQEEANLWPDGETSEPVAADSGWDCDEEATHEPTLVTEPVDVEHIDQWDATDSSPDDEFQDNRESLQDWESPESGAWGSFSESTEDEVEALEADSATSELQDENNYQPTVNWSLGLTGSEVEDSPNDASDDDGSASAELHSEGAGIDDSLVNGSLASLLIQDIENDRRQSLTGDNASLNATDDTGEGYEATAQWNSSGSWSQDENQSWDQEHQEELYRSEWSNSPDGYRVEAIDAHSPLEQVDGFSSESEEQDRDQSDVDGSLAHLDDSANDPSSLLPDASEIETSDLGSDTDPEANVDEPLSDSATEAFGSEDDEDSIEAYMNRLLQRVQGPG